MTLLNPNISLKIIRDMEKKYPPGMTYGIPMTRSECSKLGHHSLSNRDRYFIDEMSQLVGMKCTVLGFDVDDKDQGVLVLLDGGVSGSWYFHVNTVLFEGTVPNFTKPPMPEGQADIDLSHMAEKLGKLFSGQ